MVDKECTPPGAALGDTGFGYTLSVVSGKHKAIIIYSLAQNGGLMRFNELHRRMKNISYKVLSSMLKELEGEGIVERHEYPQIPPRVEYTLTDKGASLLPLLEEMCAWGKKNRPQRRGLAKRAAVPPPSLIHL